MRIQGVEIPDVLTQAIEEDRLVIFAGAGVSMQPPDPLPDFTDLVEGIARRVKPTASLAHRHGNERYETYLGRIAEPAALKQACAEVMSPGTYSTLHTNILRLFAGGQLRIVTTNYDLRFENAARDRGMTLRSFSSPALPLGNDIKGIVHLHGDVSHPDEMILVDSDYGSAYVSDGWVARFLVKMFSRYVVLFVGYSLSDVPVQYLVRSISTELQDRVYVLETEPNDFSKWRERGITPIPFDTYEQLPELFREWSQRVLRTQSQRRSAVARISSTGEQLTDYDVETLRKAFGSKDFDERGDFASAFVRAARGYESLRMLVDLGYGSFLFQDVAEPRDEVFRAWAAEAFATTKYRELVLLAEEAHKPFGGRFQRLVMERLSKGDADDECLAFWASFLDARAMGASGLRADTLADVIGRCQHPEVALAYVRKAFSVHAAYRVSEDGSLPADPAVRFDIDVTQGFPALREAISAHAKNLGLELLDACISCLEYVNELTTCHGLHADRNSPTQAPLTDRAQMLFEVTLEVARYVASNPDLRDDAIHMCHEARSPLSQAVAHELELLSW